MFGLVTFVCGDFLAPSAERLASQLRAGFTGNLDLSSAGAWIKEHAITPQGERNYSISVGSAEGGSTLKNVRIFEFDGEGRLLRRTAAAEAKVGSNGLWTLHDVDITQWNDSTQSPSVDEEKRASLVWQSTLSPKLVAASVLPVSTMSTLDLWRFISHLSDNEQAAQDCRRSSSGSVRSIPSPASS